MEFILPLAYFSLFVFIFFRSGYFNVPGISKKEVIALYSLKVFAGFTLWGIYIFYYKNRATADIFKYYDDSEILYNALFSHPSDYFKMLFGIHNNTAHFAMYYDQMFNWHRKMESNLYNESHIIIRFNAFLRIFSLGIYPIHILVMCFMSTSGLIGIYKFFYAGFTDKPKMLLLCLFITPSVLLWTSGIIKEAFIISFLGILLYYLDNCLQKRKEIRSLIIVILSLLVLISIKVYVMVAFIPAMIAYIWAYTDSKKKIFLKYFIVIIGFIIAGVFVKIIFPDYDPLEVIRIKQADFIALSAGAASRINLNEIDPNFGSLLHNAPYALYNTCFRPLNLHDSLLISIASLENWVILLFVSVCIYFHRSLSEINWNILLMAFLFTVILYLLIGWITPVVGAIVRYKVPALPFLLLAFLHILDFEKVKTKLYSIKKQYGL